MPQSYADFINAAFRNKDYLAAQQEANRLVEQAPDFLAKKQAELASADPALQALTTERGRLRGQLYATPAQGQQDYRDIFDPIKRQALIAQAIGNTTGLLSSAEARMQQRQGTTDQLAQRAYDVFKTQLEQKQGTVKSMGDYLQKLADKGYESEQKKIDRQNALLDYETKRKLDAKYRGGGGGSTSVAKTDKEDYNQSLLGLGEVVISSGEAGPGEITREQAAEILAKQYPWKSIRDIKKEIYDTYPDSYREGRGISQTSSGGAARNILGTVNMFR